MFLGVDGGGTKTAFCLLDRQARLVSTVESGSSYYYATGMDGLERVIARGVASICQEAGIEPSNIDYAFFGLPAYGESSRDQAMLDALPARVLAHHRYRCDNDMVCGWAGSLGTADGINVIAGTGSMTYGEHAGQSARCGGWGELFGDEGSAYWIAVQGLACYAKMSDGRLPRSLLHDLLKEHLALSSDLDVIDLILNQWHSDRTKVAALSKCIVDAAERGDAAACNILSKAASELAQLVDVTRKRLNFATTEPVPVSYSGGVFNAGASLIHALGNQLHSLHAGYVLQPPLFSPVVGAAIYAAKLNNTPVDIQRMAVIRV